MIAADAAGSAAPGAPAAARRAASAWNAVLLVAFVAGTALRLWQIDIQVLIEDEWHAIHKLLRAGPLDIFTHLGHADYSIPLTLYYQWLYRHVGLSEWAMHAPSLVASVALLLVGPRLLARSFPLPVRAMWLALVAISPLLVYHGKVARPYALTSLLTFVAVIAFRSWWLQRRRRDAVVYVVATFFAGWLHLVSLTFALLPFVHYGVPALSRALRGRHGGSAVAARAALWRLVVLGIATALPLAAVLAPPLVVDWSQFTAKAARDFVTPQSVYRTLLMLAGTANPFVALLLYAAVAAGFVRLRARDADLAAYLATVAGVGAIVVAASGAEWISHALVLARYSIPALPFVLLLAGEGIVAMVAVMPFATARAAAGAALAVALFVTGPIPGQWHYPNQFWGHMMYQFDYDPAHNPYVELVGNAPVSPFYRELRKRPPGSVTLVETPWRLESQFNPQPVYQAVHRQLVRIGLVTPLCGDYDFGEYPETRTGLRMRELVHLSALLRGDVQGADYLVVHAVPAYAGSPWPDMRQCLPVIVARLGPPVYRDALITVFALSPLGNNRRPVQQ